MKFPIDSIVKAMSKVNNHINYEYSQPEGFNIKTDLAPAISQNSRIRFLIIHYTAGEFDASAKTLTTGLVSSHYLVNDTLDSYIDLLVDESQRAWHAGISNWQGFSNINDTSIGIEIVNLGYRETDSLKSYRDYPNHQIEKVAALSKAIIQKYQIQPQYVLGHSDVAPTRKSDPGPKFPWKYLYEKHQIGMWYDSIQVEQIKPKFPLDSLSSPNFIRMVQQDLNTLGYAFPVMDVWDKNAQRVVEKFQHHFRPTNYNGEMDSESWAILQSLVDKYIKSKDQASNHLKYAIFNNPPLPSIAPMVAP